MSVTFLLPDDYLDNMGLSEPEFPRILGSTASELLYILSDNLQNRYQETALSVFAVSASLLVT